MKSSSGKKPVRIYLLTGESVLLVFDCKAVVKEVFDQVCAMHSIKETQFFGLSATIENEHRFMDLKQRLLKYAPKDWGKERKKREGDLSIQPASVFTMQFQVQFYVEHPKLICDPPSRNHYYLQMKRNVLQSKVLTLDENILTLAAISLHLDLGPYDSSLHTGRYFNPSEYVPDWFSKKWSENYLWSHLPAMHKELLSTSAFHAQSDYIKLASTIYDVPVHYYKLFKNKKETESSITLEIFNQGIRIHHITQLRPEGPCILDFEFPWNKVRKFYFHRQRFEIHPDELPSCRKLIYYTGSRSRSKYLLHWLTEIHSLFSSLTPFVEHLKQVDHNKGKRLYRESYISGMSLDDKMVDEEKENLVGGLGRLNPESGKDSKRGREKPFKSYTSSTSHGSSHTSGIESDTKQKPETEDGDVLDNGFLDGLNAGKSTDSSIDAICVTNEHLAAPPHKSLSVSNLVEGHSHGLQEKLFADLDLENSGSNDTIRNNEGIPNETAGIVILPPLDPDTSKAAQENTLPEHLRSDVNLNDITVNTDREPIEVIQVKDGEYTDKLFKISHHNSSSTHSSQKSIHTFSESISAKIDSLPEPPTSIPGSHRDLPWDDYIPSQHQLLSPTNHHSSNTFYDDTHTIPRRNRAKSHDTGLSEKVLEDVTKHYYRKFNSVDQDITVMQMHKSCSTESILWQPPSGDGHENAAEFLTYPGRQCQILNLKDGEVSNGFSSHLGSNLWSNKSVDDLRVASEDCTLRRSAWQRNIPQSQAIESKPQKSDGVYDHPQSGLPFPSPVKSKIDHYVGDHRKMSDVCHKTLVAQHRNKSDVRNANGQRRRRSDFDRPHSAVCAKPNALGNTPYKTKVFFGTNNHKRKNGIRPLSYHMPQDTPYGHKTISGDDSITVAPSRSRVYIDDFTEMIV